jgi:hypothetical protein
MTNYNQRLDEILNSDGGVLHCCGDYQEEAKQAIISLIKELVAEAKPEPTKYEKYNSDCLEGFNIATDEFEQNLLKALETLE